MSGRAWRQGVSDCGGTLSSWHSVVAPTRCVLTPLPRVSLSPRGNQVQVWSSARRPAAALSFYSVSPAVRRLTDPHGKVRLEGDLCTALSGREAATRATATFRDQPAAAAARLSVIESGIAGGSAKPEAPCHSACCCFCTS